jgi:hypothetical protein
MALNASGAISLGGATVGQSINLELGLSGTAQIGMNDAAVRTLLGVSSGAISLSNAYGKSSTKYFISRNNYPVRAYKSWVGSLAITSDGNPIFWGPAITGDDSGANFVRVNKDTGAMSAVWYKAEAGYTMPFPPYSTTTTRMGIIGRDYVGSTYAQAHYYENLTSSPPTHAWNGIGTFVQSGEFRSTGAGAVDSAGNMYILWTKGDVIDECGTRYHRPGIMKVNSAGTYQMARSCNDYKGEPYDAICDQSDNLIVAQSPAYYGHSGGILFVKYSTSDLTKIWAKQYQGLLGGYFQARSMICDASNNIYICTQNGQNGAGLTKLNSSGVRQFSYSRNYEGNQISMAGLGSITIGPDGYIYMCWTNYGGNSSSAQYNTGRMVIVKLDTSGNVQWQRYILIPAMKFIDGQSEMGLGNHIKVTSDAVYVGAGQTDGSSSLRWAYAKLRRDGSGTGSFNSGAVIYGTESVGWFAESTPSATDVDITMNNLTSGVGFSSSSGGTIITTNNLSNFQSAQTVTDTL